jgi:hypothetical protein
LIVYRRFIVIRGICVIRGLSCGVLRVRAAEASGENEEICSGGPPPVPIRMIGGKPSLAAVPLRCDFGDPPTSFV